MSKLIMEVMTISVWQLTAASGGKQTLSRQESRTFKKKMVEGGR